MGTLLSGSRVQEGVGIRFLNSALVEKVVTETPIVAARQATPNFRAPSNFTPFEARFLTGS
jgi:hypothetical protein